ncbi:hypothetical protein B0H17DRAFT_1123892 [Mycena rosella]|uniref:Uncharacterized protein n=1 Tax=Mycena rosella TaxID=1033263 RepID=A0AAD7H3T9_MYCRO|nr:hypothetical protein B0H17DRAFT_1123892 [Mycena rosella]
MPLVPPVPGYRYGRFPNGLLYELADGSNQAGWHSSLFPSSFRPVGTVLHSSVPSADVSTSPRTLYSEPHLNTLKYNLHLLSSPSIHLEPFAPLLNPMLASSSSRPSGSCNKPPVQKFRHYIASAPTPDLINTPPEVERSSSELFNFKGCDMLESVLSSPDPMHNLFTATPDKHVALSAACLGLSDLQQCCLSALAVSRTVLYVPLYFLCRQPKQLTRLVASSAWEVLDIANQARSTVQARRHFPWHVDSEVVRNQAAQISAQLPQTKLAKFSEEISKLKSFRSWHLGLGLVAWTVKKFGIWPDNSASKSSLEAVVLRNSGR